MCKTFDTKVAGEPRPFKLAHPLLYAEAKSIAIAVCNDINRADLSFCEHPYKRQGLLETLIEILQESV